VSARNKHGQCPYCGRHAKLTRDHVPPRALFRARPPEELITVLCCSACNKAASLDDEYFRLNLALRDDIGQEPDIVEIIPAVLRSLERPEAPGLRTEFLQGVRNAAVTTPAGLFLGSRLAYNVDLDRLGRVPSRIVKAMFYRHHSRRLPEAYRETLILRLVEGMTGPEIAAQTGLTPESVRVNLCRGMKLLRELLESK